MDLFSPIVSSAPPCGLAREIPVHTSWSLAFGDRRWYTSAYTKPTSTVRVSPEKGDSRARRSPLHEGGSPCEVTRRSRPAAAGISVAQADNDFMREDDGARAFGETTLRPSRKRLLSNLVFVILTPLGQSARGVARCLRSGATSFKGGADASKST